MRAFVLSVIFISGFCLFPLSATTTPEDLVKEVLTSLSTDFTKSIANNSFRPTIALLKIEDQSDDAKKHNISESLYPLIESLLKRSNVFELVERRNLSTLLKEQEFALTGLAGEVDITKYSVKEADYILKGSISELGSNIQLALNIVSVIDGSIVASATSSISKDVLIAVADEFASKYVSAYGLGIELSTTPFTYWPSNPAQLEQGVTNAITASLDLNYRLSKEWVLYFGAEYSLLIRNREPFTTTSYDQRQSVANTLSLSSPGTIAGGSSTLIEYSNMRNLTTFFLGGAWVLNITREFNISIGADARFGIMNDSQVYTIGDGVTKIPMDITANNVFVMAEPQIKFQFYLNPRLSLHFGYSFWAKIADLSSVDYTYQGRRYRQDYGVAIDAPDYGSPNPWIDPISGKPILFDYTGHRLFFGVGFYF